MTYDEIKSWLNLVDDPAQKLEMIMEIGARVPSVPQGAQCSEIVGCASRVEFCRLDNHFYVSADSAIVRGVAAVIAAMVDGKSADEIKQMDIAGEFARLNLQLGAGRLNGINSMIRFLQNL